MEGKGYKPRTLEAGTFFHQTSYYTNIAVGVPGIASGHFRAQQLLPSSSWTETIWLFSACCGIAGN